MIAARNRLKRLNAAVAAMLYVAMVPGGVTAASISPSPEGQPSILHCTEPRSAFERAACFDPKVSAAYKRMWAAYNRGLMATPAEWKGQVGASQRSWMAYMSTFCLPGDLRRREDGATKSSCWIGEMKDRETSLADIIQKVGTRSFIKTIQYVAKASTDGFFGVDLPTSESCQIERTQIMAPANAAERQWNAMIAHHLDKVLDDGCGLTQVYVVIEATSSDFIDTVVNVTDSSGAHPSTGLTALPWSLRLGRLVTAADLFSNPQQATDAMARLYIRDWRKSAADAGEEFDEYLVKDVVKFTQNAKYWSIEEKGIMILGEDARSQSFRLADYLAWADLKPYLRKDLPVDISTLKSAN